MGLESIVNVQITAETAAVTQAGFGVPLVLGDEPNFPERVRVYTSAADMLEDGFTTSSPSYLAVQAILAQNPKVPRVKVAMRAAETEIAEDLAAIQAIDDDWYGLVLANASKDDALAAAAYIESTRKLLALTSDDAAILDPLSDEDLAAELKNKGYARTFLFFGPSAEHGGAAMMGKCFPFDPGSETWKFKTLRGVSVSKLSASEQATLKAKNCNFYVEVGGIPITQEGVTSSGEFIDITRGVDWLQARMQEGIFGTLARAGKVPFSDPGIGLIEAQVRAVLTMGVDVGLLAADPEPTVTVPRAQDVPVNDRAARRLTGVRFSAQLAGAIHSLEVQGTVSV